LNGAVRGAAASQNLVYAPPRAWRLYDHPNQERIGFMTPDGKVIAELVAESRWQIKTFRFQNVTRLPNGEAQWNYPNRPHDNALSAGLIVTHRAGDHGWIFGPVAAYPNPRFGRNAFPSDAAGNPVGAVTSSHRTYDLIVIGQIIDPAEPILDPREPNAGKVRRLGMRGLSITVENWGRPNARIARAEFSPQDWQVLTMGPGPFQNRDLTGLNPTVTEDGRLLIWEGGGAPNFRGTDLVYSLNEHPGRAHGWSVPRYISSLCTESAEIKNRYPLAQQCLKVVVLRNAGQATERPEQITAEPDSRAGLAGAYPWVSLDGSELFYTSVLSTNHILTRQPDGMTTFTPTRSAYAAIGRLTNWELRHLDGPINHGPLANYPGMVQKVWHPGPGRIPGMWDPFRDIPNAALPLSPHRPLYPFFYQGQYFEVSFHDSASGKYVGYWPLNELVYRTPAVAPSLYMIYDVHFGFTPDTSGNANTGQLKQGATFPYRLAQQVVTTMGLNGQAVLFPESGYVHIPRPHSVERGTRSAWTVHFTVFPVTRASAPRGIVYKPGQFNVVLYPNGSVQSAFHTSEGIVTTRPSAAQISLDQWTHVAVVFSGRDVITYFNGAEVDRMALTKAATPSTAASDLFLGPMGPGQSSAIFYRLDDVGIANVAFTPKEVQESAYRIERSVQSKEKRLVLPNGLHELRTSSAEADNTDLNPRVVRLGARLFFDPVLSGGRNIACASCHAPHRGFADGRPRGLGVRALTRSTPSVINRVGTSEQLWDGRAKSLEEQALLAITHPDEMAGNVGEVVRRLNDQLSYRAHFLEAFNAPPSGPLIGRALAAFQRTILNGNSKVDRFEDGEDTALNASEKRGRELFRGKARCISCHHGPNYTDESFHNVALKPFSDGNDAGRAIATGRPEDARKFKTPTLRNLSATAPYMHDGSVATLEDVVRLYNAGGESPEALRNAQPPSKKDLEIFPLELNEQEIADLVAFLRALDGETTAGLGNLVEHRVREAWRDLLEREPTAMEVAQAIDRMASGETIAQYRQSLVAGTAVRELIIQAWNEVLGASPAAAALAEARTLLANGTTLAAYRRSLAESADGIARRRSLVREVFGLNHAAESLLMEMVTAQLLTGGSLSSVRTMLTNARNIGRSPILPITFEALHALHPSCSRSALPLCRAAIQRACSRLGFMGGYGPVEASTIAHVTCVSPKEGATISATHRELASAHPACNPVGNTETAACDSAVGRLCAARDPAFLSGYGVMERNSTIVVVGCFRSAGSTRYRLPLTELSRLHPGCDQSFDPIACRSAVHRACRARNARHVSGYGPVESDPSFNTVIHCH
jgi:cytochrome c peroxidase